jgi:hypothetical protein
MINCAIYRRLEAQRPQGSLERGFRAEVADPLWLLGRQWQLGEHAGEDASSPVLVDVTSQHVEVDPLPGHVELDPTRVPLEGVVERELDDWWTPGRRVRLGTAYATATNMGPTGLAQPSVVVTGLPAPYDSLNGQAYDGLALWHQDPGHAVFADVPGQPAESWDPAELVYTAILTAGTIQLTMPRHDGGRLDWYSVDAAGPAPASAAQTRNQRLLPNRMSYPGAPHPRWWQIEDHAVDIGGFPPDRGHFATMLLVELVVSHADDWFTFPVSTRTGNVVRLDIVKAIDSFDEIWPLTPPSGWELFRLRGLDATSLLVWPTVATPLHGAVLEEVLFSIDEDANALFAVELRAGGHDLPTEGVATGPTQPPPAAGAQPVDASTRLQYRYRPSAGARRYWHPYLLQDVGGRRRFVQGRLADLDATSPTLFPEPVAEVLYDRANLAPDPADQVEPVHQIEPATIPRYGLRLTRQRVLARDVDGNPMLWVQRRRLPLHDPPISTLRYDTLIHRTPASA